MSSRTKAVKNAMGKSVSPLNIARILRCHQFADFRNEPILVSPVEQKKTSHGFVFRVVRTEERVSRPLRFRNLQSRMAYVQAMQLTKNILSQYSLEAPQKKFVKSRVPLDQLTKGKYRLFDFHDFVPAKRIKGSVVKSRGAAVGIAIGDGAVATVFPSGPVHSVGHDAVQQSIIKFYVEVHDVKVSYDEGVLSIYEKDELVSQQRLVQSQRKISRLGAIDKDALRAEILRFVGYLRPYLAIDYKDYMDLWEKILAIPEVDALVYNQGKQKGTTFNRNLVASIIYMLGHYGPDKKQSIFTNYIAKKFTIALKYDPERSLRTALGNPPPSIIYNKVLELLPK